MRPVQLAVAALALGLFTGAAPRPFAKVAQDRFELRGRAHAIAFGQEGASWLLAGTRPTALRWAVPVDAAPRVEPGNAELRFASAALELRIAPLPNGLHYEATLPAGSDTSEVRLRYSGASAVTVERADVLRVDTAAGPLHERGLRCFQRTPAGEREVRCAYGNVHAEAPGEWSYAIELGARDPRYPVEIDPDVTWTQEFATAGFDEVASMAALCDSLYVAGTVSGAVFTGPDGGFFPEPKQKLEGFVARYRPDGGMIWGDYLSGDQDEGVSSLSLLASGSLLATGSTTSSSFIGTSSEPFPRKTDGFVVRFAPDGTRDRGYRFASDGGEDLIHEAVDDFDGGVFFAGSTRFTGWTSDAVLGRLDPSFKLLWTAPLGGSLDETPRALVYAPDAGLFVAGITTSPGAPVPWTDRAEGTMGGNDIFIARVNPDDGTRIWAVQWGGFGNEDLTALRLRGGYLYAAGTNAPGSPLKSSDGGHLPGGNREPLLMRLDTDGNVLWVSEFGGAGDDEILALAETESAFYLAGSTTSAAFSGNTYNFGGAGTDMLLMRVVPEGPVTRTDTWKVGGAGTEVANAVAVDQRGAFFGGSQSGTGGDINAWFGFTAYPSPPEAPVPSFSAEFCRTYDLVEPDAGTGDAGTPTDAGSDGGATRDGGVQPDGGVGFDDRSAFGWSCGAAAGLPLLVAALPLVLLARRRRR